MGRSLLLRLFLKREFCFNWILERQFFAPEVNRSCYRIRIWLCCFLSGLWWYLDFFSSSPAAHEPPASSALSSSSAGGRTSLLYSDLSEIASSGSNEAREAVEGDYLLQTMLRDKDPGGLYSSSGNHESNSSIALPSTNLSPLPNIQPALLSNLERNHLSLYLSEIATKEGR